MKTIFTICSLFFATIFGFSQSVFSVIQNSDAHDTLEAAILVSGLVDTLNSDGPFTVFAPSDSAFSLLEPGVLDTLLTDPSGDLMNILLHHITADSLGTDSLLNGSQIIMLSGDTTLIHTDSTGIYIDSIRLSVTDILADNGIVHVIDAVLLPPGVEDTMMMTNTVVDIIVNSDEHTTLETAVIAAQLDDDLAGTGPFTVFAPTDSAFAALPEGLIDSLLMNPTGELANILLYHVANGTVLSTDLADSMMIPTLLGDDVLVTIDSSGVFVNGAQLIVADIMADNGIVHVIDAVLLPPVVEDTMMMTNTVVDIIVNSDEHTTLETAVIAAQLDDDLAGTGPFTVFAPTDSAFAALPEGLIDSLLMNPTGELADILLYHVANGTVLFTDLTDSMMIPTLLGDDVLVTIDSSGVFVNGAQVTVADIMADNGIVHVIDAVLLPPVVEDTMMMTNTVVDIIVNSDVHTTLETAIISAQLDDDLAGTGPFTVFAPTDSAFAALPEGLIDSLLMNPTGELADILLYHVANGTVLFTDLTDSMMIPTLLGDDVLVTIDSSGVFVNGAQVTVADIMADNGIVHVIDAVLLPPVVEDTMMLTNTVVDIIVNSDVHTTLETAIIAAQLDDDLAGTGPFTVFAPTDSAFAALPGGLIDSLLMNPTGELANILLYHVANGTVLSTDLADSMMIPTLLGDDVLVTIDSSGVFVNGAQVTVADIMADNGIVHVIDAVLLPPVVEDTMMMTNTVVDIIVNSDEHTTLETAIISAQLDDDLAGTGPFTVFAPTDSAFAALPEGLIDSLLMNPTGDLADILLYHVANGAVLSTDLTDSMMIPTLLGDDVLVTVDSSGVFVNGAQVTVADIMADNGIVHVIDAVLLPPVVEDTMMMTNTVVDIIVNSEEHNVLEAAILASGLDSDLTGNGPFTIFAPTDSAFTVLPDGMLDSLLADPSGDLSSILLYHVLGARFATANFSDGQMINTLQGEDVMILVNQDAVWVNDVIIRIANLEAVNGVVHVIDAVLLPPSLTSVKIQSIDHSGLTVAPNPIINSFSIRGNSSPGNNEMNVKLINNLGQVTRVWNKLVLNQSIMASGVAPGSYYILIETAGSSYIDKVVFK